MINLSIMKFQKSTLKLNRLTPLIITLVVVFLCGATVSQFRPEPKIPTTYKADGTKITVTKVNDDDEEHYHKLGLTPNHSVRVRLTDLNGNAIKGSRDIIYHGRFLHITDMHPDLLNKLNSSIVRKCHKKDSKALPDELCHKFGDAMSGCDSPISLYEDSLAWIRKNLKDKIDFVIWTGDNVRHDNDRSNPRLESDIFAMNEKVANKMEVTFMDEGEETKMPQERRVKIIPSLGNNDVYPHNLVAPGPTLQTREMYKIWRSFVPAEQMHTFDRGIYYFREVIPGRLAVLSINTLYFFKSNPLNDNCDGRKQPGYKLFEWLSITLKELRRRHMKVWLSGHVPPIPKNLHYSCYTKMAVWMHEYRDIIIGGVWGHMNTDHFVPLDSVKAWRSIRNRLNTFGLEDDANSLNFETYGEEEESLAEDGYDNDDDAVEDFKDDVDMYRAMGLLDDDFGVNRKSKRYESAPVGKVTYLAGIRDSLLVRIKGKKKAGEHGERYSFAHVSASVIPTYNPGFRVWEYNITDLFANFNEHESFEPWDKFFAKANGILDQSDELAETLQMADNITANKQYYTLKKDITIPPIMPSDINLGPGYVKQLFSPERYTQYYADLDRLQKSGEQEINYNVQYSTDDETYNMSSLLVEDWIKLSRKLSESSPLEKGKTKKGKKEDFAMHETDDDNTAAARLWQKFIDRAFISTGYQNFPFATQD